MTNLRADKTNFEAGKTPMSAEYIAEAKRMSGFVLAREYRGIGDTIEAAAGRIETKYGVPVATTMRLRNREVKDMFVSSFFPILNAYLAVTQKLNQAADRMEQAYETERNRTVDTRLRRLADSVAGFKEEAGE